MTCRSIYSPSRVIKLSMDRPAPALSTLVQGPMAAYVPGGRGEPAAIRRARSSPLFCPTSWKAARPTCWGPQGLPRGSTGSWNAGQDNLRTHEVSLLQQVVDWVEGTDAWRIAGRWDPSTHVGALSLLVPEGLTPQDLGSILDVSFDIAVRPGLHCAPISTAHSAPFPMARSGSVPVPSPPLSRSTALSRP